MLAKFISPHTHTIRWITGEGATIYAPHGAPAPITVPIVAGINEADVIQIISETPFTTVDLGTFN